MIGIFVILACWGVGNLLSMLTGGYVSGNVIGMVLLYAMLHYRVVKASRWLPWPSSCSEPWRSSSYHSVWG